MAMTEEIARLTGSLVFKTDYKQLVAFEKRLASVEGKLRAFSDLANKKFNIKVTLDAKSLRAQLERAANAKVVFKNFSADTGALEKMRASIAEKIGNTHINLKNVKLNVSEIVGQRALLRQQLGNTSLHIRVGINTREANATLRAWKATTEQRFKLHINADISAAKLFRNAAATLRRVGARLGTFMIKSPQVRLSIDRGHLRAEIAAVLAQIQREVRIKMDLTSKGTVVNGGRGRASGEGGSRHGVMGGLGGEGMGLARGFLPGLGAAYSISKLNEINQQQIGQQHAMMAVTGDAGMAAAMKRRLDNMGNEIGFNSREMAPSFIKMVASGQGSGFKQAQSEQIFKSMTEYGRVMGLNGEEMKGSLRAVEQMMNKGQIMAEELKGQLGERFPAAVALMAESQKKTIPELLKTMKAGQLTSAALLPFAELLSKKARQGGALDLAENATAAQQFRMENAFSKSVENFSAGGFDSATGKFFKYVADAILKSQGLIKALGATFEWLMMPVYAVIEMLGRLGKIWPDLADGIGLTSKELAILAGMAGVLLLPFGGFLLAAGLLAVALQDVMVYARGGQSVFGEWIKSTPEAKKAVEDLTKAWSDFANKLKELFGKDSLIDNQLVKTGKLKTLMETLSFSNQLIVTMERLATILDYMTKVMDRMQKFSFFEKELPTQPPGSTRTAAAYGGSEDVPQTEQGEWDNKKIFHPTPMTAFDVQRQQMIKTTTPQVLPGINSPLAGGELGGVPKNQGGIMAGLGTSGNIEHHGAIQIIIQAGNESDDKLAAKVRDELQKVFQTYLPKEVQ